MAVNKPTGDNARKGAVKKRSQLATKTMGKKTLDQAGQDNWRIHGSEEGAGKEKVQGRAQGALMGKLSLVALANGFASLIKLAAFAIHL
jgi:hypothetical protein